jgi:hypothetical protein
MSSTHQAREIAGDDQGRNSNAQWPELVSRAVNDVSRIVHAEIRLAELGIKALVEQEIDRALKVVISLSLLICAAICAVGAGVIGLHALLGFWWAAFAIVAAISGILGIGLFLLTKRRPQPIASS